MRRVSTETSSCLPHAKHGRRTKWPKTQCLRLVTTKKYSWFCTQLSYTYETFRLDSDFKRQSKRVTHLGLKQVGLTDLAHAERPIDMIPPLWSNSAIPGKFLHHIVIDNTRWSNFDNQRSIQVVRLVDQCERTEAIPQTMSRRR